jgi:hypothetical protein
MQRNVRGVIDQHRLLTLLERPSDQRPALPPASHRMEFRSRATFWQSEIFGNLRVARSFCICRGHRLCPRAAHTRKHPWAAELLNSYVTVTVPAKSSIIRGATGMLQRETVLSRSARHRQKRKR